MIVASPLFQEKSRSEPVRKPDELEPKSLLPAEKKRDHTTSGLRVLIVAFQGGQQADGGVESLTQLIEGYKSVRLTILSQVETAKNNRWRSAGCEVRIWPLGYRPGQTGGLSFTLFRLFQVVAWNLKIAWLVLRQQTEVVHINDPHALWHVIFGLRLLGTPTIYNIRDTKPGFSGRDLIKWRLSFLLTDAQIVLSREMRDFWRKALGVSAKRLAAVSSIVDFQRMAPSTLTKKRELRAKLGLPDVFIAGYIASFSEKKSQLAFIKNAGAEFRRKLPEAKIYFVGDFKPSSDPYAEECERLTEAEGLQDRLIFIGYTAAVEEWYQAVDAVVVATRNEGLARCMIESLACGTPVASFDVCSAREVLEGGGCGAVVPHGDYIGLVTILAQWSENKAARSKLGQQGVRWTRKRFARVSAVQAYTEIYWRAAGKATGV